MSLDRQGGGSSAVAVASLLAGAMVWGLIWYPYRSLQDAGLSGALASVFTYGIALACGVPILGRRLRGARFSWWLPAIAVAAGACNLGYVLAVLPGEVMRVLLLFYLSPLWTVLLARLLLDERLNAAGAAVVGCSLAGATIMLWHPTLGLPWPRNAAEWLGLGAGFGFALNNVLIRRAAHLRIEQKTLAVFAGVVLLGLVALPFEPTGDVTGLAAVDWLVLAMTGLLLLVVNLVVQVGLTGLTANRAIVIMLSELVFAAVSSWLLAGERMGSLEWAGGSLIVVASLFSGKLEAESA
mgnify:CR=1 FL=1